MLGDAASYPEPTAPRPPSPDGGALGRWVADLEARHHRLTSEVAGARQRLTDLGGADGDQGVERQVGALILEATHRLRREREVATVVVRSVRDAADAEVERILAIARAEVQLLARLAAALAAAPPVDGASTADAAPTGPERLAV
jgi:transposase